MFGWRTLSKSILNRCRWHLGRAHNDNDQIAGAERWALQNRSRTPARSRLVTALPACLTPARRSLPTRLDRLAAAEACWWRGTVHGVPELSAHPRQRLIEVLDCTVTLR